MNCAHTMSFVIVNHSWIGLTWIIDKKKKKLKLSDIEMAENHCYSSYSGIADQPDSLWVSIHPSSPARQASRLYKLKSTGLNYTGVGLQFTSLKSYKCLSLNFQAFSLKLGLSRNRSKPESQNFLCYYVISRFFFVFYLQCGRKITSNL